MKKSFDLREIRNQLPKGSLKTIANSLGVKPRIVSEVLKYNWHPVFRNKVIASALSIIRSKEVDQELLKEAEELHLTTSELLSVPYKRKAKRTPAKKRGWFN